MNLMKKKSGKISRGYRLNKTTHDMIRKLIIITQENSDSVISRSCELYFKQLSGQNYNSGKNKSLKQ